MFPLAGTMSKSSFRDTLAAGIAFQISGMTVPKVPTREPVKQPVRLREQKEYPMDITVSEEVQAQLDQVKEWMESKIGREVTYNDVILQILKNFQSILYPEDLGRA
jgi:hypothetical protein